MKMRILTTTALLLLPFAAIAQGRDGIVRILSACHGLGLDPIPLRATALCGTLTVGRWDEEPVTFSVQINIDPIFPSACAVETSSGVLVTPVYTTRRPAVKSLEQLKALLFGPLPSPVVAVSVLAGLFHAPGDGANPETSIDVISKMIE